MFADPIDPPTLSMAFGVNDSPLAGRDGGTLLTGSLIAERLRREAETNVALEVVTGVSQAAQSAGGDTFMALPDATEVHARGELQVCHCHPHLETYTILAVTSQLAILIESMRREGFELSVSPPAVLFKIDPTTGERTEPYEE